VDAENSPFVPNLATQDVERNFSDTPRLVVSKPHLMRTARPATSMAGVGTSDLSQQPTQLMRQLIRRLVSRAKFLPDGGSQCAILRRYKRQSAYCWKVIRHESPLDYRCRESNMEPVPHVPGNAVVSRLAPVWAFVRSSTIRNLWLDAISRTPNTAPSGRGFLFARRCRQAIVVDGRYRYSLPFLIFCAGLG
jgi:hypothetical protein